MSQRPLFDRITGEELKAKMKTGNKVAGLDVLTGEQHALRRIPGSVNACVYEMTFPDQVAKVLPDKRGEVVVYGASADSREADAAAEKLQRLGFEKIWVLEGGLEGWIAAGFDLEGSDTSVPAVEAPFILEDREYEIDTAQSQIEWAGRNANKTHNGTLMLSEGNITKAKDGISGRFVVDMKSIRNFDLEGDELQPVLLAHLSSDDFFFVKLFPRAVFTIKSARRSSNAGNEDRQFDVMGEFELRGIRGDLNFQATLGPHRDGGVSIEAHFDLDRTRFGVLYGCHRFYQHLGMHLVYDPISIGIRLVTI